MANNFSPGSEQPPPPPIPRFRRWRANLILLAFIVLSYACGCAATILLLGFLKSWTHWSLFSDDGTPLIQLGGAFAGVLPAYFVADFVLSRRRRA